MRIFTISLLLLVGSALALPAETPKRILFVGNSYTGQIRASLTKLVAASPHRSANLEFITPGGRTLAQHAQNPKTVARIREGDWDYVVLQDQSQTPAIFPDKFKKAAAELDDIISKSSARTVFYQTWGRRDGDKRNAHAFPTYEKMQAALTKSYSNAARRHKAKLAPVGEAWRLVREKLPDLGKELYKGDGSHPSAKGAFLAACCIYATVFDADPAKVSFDGGLSKTDASHLRKAAAAAIRARSR